MNNGQNISTLNRPTRPKNNYMINIINIKLKKKIIY